MSIFGSFLETVRSWRRRRGGSKTSQRAAVNLERLDHRQLLTGTFSGSLPFTGNVTTDFPTALVGKGVAERTADPVTDVVSSIGNPQLAAAIGTNGFAIDRFRVTYNPADDSLNVGFVPPGDQKVIAGDLDNSGNSADFSPQVQAIVDANPALTETFVEPPRLPSVPGTPVRRGNPDMQGTKFMYAFLDLNGDGQSDIVAGFPQDLGTNLNAPAKVYQVALADNTNPAQPRFGPPLDTRFWGNVYLVNDPRHPNLEFQIKNFRELYSGFNNGQLPGPTKSFAVGLTAGQLLDPVLNDTLIALKPMTFTEATLPPQCPVTPPIKVNPHQNAHINTAHPTDVQVVVYGTPTFNVNTITPGTVSIANVDGTTARPIFEMPARDVNHDGYLDKVYDFNGAQIKLPSGFTTVTVNGQLNDYNGFTNTVPVFNRDDTFYTASQIAQRNAKWAAGGPSALLTPKQRQILAGKNTGAVVNVNDAAIEQLVAEGKVVANPTTGTATFAGSVQKTVVNPMISVAPPTVAVKARNGLKVTQPKALKVITNSSS